MVEKDRGFEISKMFTSGELMFLEGALRKYEDEHYWDDLSICGRNVFDCLKKDILSARDYSHAMFRKAVQGNESVE